jgi:hypothetical protein
VSSYDEGSHVGTAYVDILPDLRKFQPTLASGMAGSGAAAATSAGEKVGASYGQGFTEAAAESTSKGTVSALEQAEKGAVASSLGLGRRAGQAITEGLGQYAKIAATTVAGYFAFEQVKSFVSGSIDAAETAEKQQRLIAAAIASTGGVANVTADHIDQLSQSLEGQTAVSHLTIQQTDGLLLRFQNVRDEVGKDNDIFDRATSTALDMSAALGKSLPSSALALGRALNDPVQGLALLTRSGVTFTDQQKAQIATMVASGNVLDAQKLILDQLGAKFSGAAEAAATPIDRLKTSFSDLEEETGQKLLPVVSAGATALVGLGNGAVAVGKAIDAVPGPVKDAALALTALGIAEAIVQTDTVQAGLALTRAGVSSGQFAASVKTAATSLTAARVGLGLLGAGLAEVSAHTKGAESTLTGIGADAAFGATALGGLGSVGIAAGAGIGALVGAYAHFASSSHVATTDVQSLTDSFNTNTGAVTRNTRELVANTLEQNGTFAAARQAGISLDLVTSAALPNHTAAVGALRAAYAAATPYSTNFGKAVAASGDGNIHAALGAQAYTEQMSPQAQAIKKVIDAVGAERGAVGAAGQAWRDTQAAMGKAVGTGAQLENSSRQLGAAVTGYTQANDKATESLKQLITQQLKEANTALGRTGDWLNYQSAIQSATSALKDDGKTLDAHTQKGLANRQALQTLAQSVAQYAGDLKGAGAQQDYLTKTGVPELIRMAESMGDLPKQAREWVNSLHLIPPKVTTQVSLDKQKADQDTDAFQAHVKSVTQAPYVATISADTQRALAQIDQFGASTKSALDRIPDEIVNVNLSAQANKVVAEMGGLPGAATGRFVTGGTPGKDSVHLLAMPGEFVLRKAAVDQLGLANVQAINDLKLPKMAAGGPVVDLFAQPQGVSSAVGSIERLLGGAAGRIGSSLSSRLDHRLASLPTGGGGTGAHGASAAAAQAYARGILGDYGWGADQMAPLIELWNRESGWNYLAKNPSSGAYGIPQALPASKMASAGADWLTDYKTQVRWGEGYIKGDYGSPAGAWAHEVDFGWYDHGGRWPSGTAGINTTGHDEYVATTKSDQAALLAEMRAVREGIGRLEAALTNGKAKVTAELTPQSLGRMDARTQAGARSAVRQNAAYQGRVGG